MSAWHTLYIRLFRIGAAQTLLLEKTPLANLTEDHSARLEPEGALIEFSSDSIDSSGVFVRKYVLHYKLDGDTVRRIEPIALTPQDFVEEWLTRTWNEIAEWSEPQLAEWHKKLHKDQVHGDFDAVRRCVDPGQWQASLSLDGKTRYFLVLDRGDYRYRMLRVSQNPRPDCKGENEMLGSRDPKPTLFPKK
jgi:hypothetical protein